MTRSRSRKTAIRDIIRYYTREAGVRSLEREISKICRKVVKMLLLQEVGQEGRWSTRKNLDKFLGVRRYDFGVAEKENQVGQVVGLAWTEVGGDLLTIEAVHDARQGRHHPHRHPGRRDEGVDRGGAHRGA